MKLILTLLFTILLSPLFSQVEFYECPLTDKKEFVKNAKLLTRNELSGNDSLYFRWKIEKGNSLVFKYTHYYSCDATNHEAVSAVLSWDIPMNLTCFEIQLNTLDSVHIPFAYSTSCGPPCSRYNFEMVNAEGVIQGVLTDNTWYVTGKIKTLLYNNRKNISVARDVVIDGSYVQWKQKRKDRKGHKFNGF